MTPDKINNNLFPNNKLLFSLFTVLFCICSMPSLAVEKQIIGWIEPVNILHKGKELRFAAKIDTGADFSSVDVESLELVTRNDKNWVRFDLEDDDGKIVTLEEPLYKITQVKRKGTGSQPRFVVLLDMCLGGIREKTRFSLVDRHNFKYRMLIGRHVLGGKFLIDSELKNITPTICPQDK